MGFLSGWPFINKNSELDVEAARLHVPAVRRRVNAAVVHLHLHRGGNLAGATEKIHSPGTGTSRHGSFEPQEKSLPILGPTGSTGLTKTPILKHQFSSKLGVSISFGVSGPNGIS